MPGRLVSTSTRSTDQVRPVRSIEHSVLADRQRGTLRLRFEGNAICLEYTKGLVGNRFVPSGVKADNPGRDTDCDEEEDQKDHERNSGVELLLVFELIFSRCAMLGSRSHGLTRR